MNPVDLAELKKVLMLFPISIVRKIVYEKELQFKSQHKEQLVDKLCEMAWTDSQLTDLKKLYNKIANEKQGKSVFLVEYDSTLTFEALIEKIKAYPFEVNEETEYISKEGFGITSTDTEGKLIECEFWSYNEKTGVGPKLHVYTIQKNICIPFKIDTNKKQVHISAQNPQYAMSCRKHIQENIDLNIIEPDIRDISSDETKNRFELLITKIKEKLEGE